MTGDRDGLAKQIIVHWGAAAVAGVFGLAIGLAGARAWANRPSLEPSRDTPNPSELSALRARLDQEEQRAKRTEEQLAEATRELTRLRASLAARTTSSGLPLMPQPPTARMPQSAAEGLIAIERVAPFQISLQLCERIGTGVSCDLLIENTSTRPAYLALGSTSTAFFAGGSECRLRDASLGSRRWSADQFGAIRLESGIPLLAKLQFGQVPDDATSGALRLVVAVVPGTGPQAFLGPNPEWQSPTFKNIQFR
jgi:hypothetical protein